MFGIFCTLLLIINIYLFKADNILIDQFNCPQNQILESMDYQCQDCTLANGNVCYTAGHVKSIYNLEDIRCENDEGNDVNCDNTFCQDGNITELDDRGNWYGKIICMNQKISDYTLKSPNNKDVPYNQFEFRLRYVNTPNRTRLDVVDNPAEVTLNPDMITEDKIKYLYNSCINGFYEQSCQQLANLCVLAMYEKRNGFCQMIDEFNTKFSQ